MIGLPSARVRNCSTHEGTALPVSAWHEIIDEPTFAYAIFDRIVHDAYRIELDGESLRKSQDPSSDAAHA